MGSERSASRTGRFTPREREPGTHWIRCGVGRRADLGAVVKRKKIVDPAENRTPVVQPVA